MTEYSNAINCGQTLRKYSCYSKQKKCRMNSKTHQINREGGHRKNANIRALSKQKCPL